MDTNSSFTKEQREEIKNIVHEALGEFFASKGKVTKQYLIGAAVVIGSLTVILGGFKAILGWLGFTYIGK
jgi:hypothetical protein